MVVVRGSEIRLKWWKIWQKYVGWTARVVNDEGRDGCLKMTVEMGRDWLDAYR
jgi:hypothetical protein